LKRRRVKGTWEKRTVWGGRRRGAGAMVILWRVSVLDDD